MITVSEKALQHVVNLMMESNITPDSHHLRVGVKGGGCSGLSYVMDFDNKIEDTDETVEIDGGLKQVIDVLVRVFKEQNLLNNHYLLKIYRKIYRNTVSIRRNRKTKKEIKSPYN